MRPGPKRKPIKAITCDGLAIWMVKNGFATGHGDTVEDLLKELAWQVKELRETVKATQKIDETNPARQ